MSRKLFLGLVPLVLVSLVSAAHAEPVNAPVYGPEGRLYMRLDRNWGMKILVQRGGSIRVRFRADAERENAVTIYDDKGNLLRYYNNYGINAGGEDFVRHFPEKGWIYITAWHKNHRPGKGPWYQSPMRIFEQTVYRPVPGGDEKFYFAGFEDADVQQHNAYNDILLRIWKFRPK